mgnify:CR=1 FL=1
MKRGLVIGKFMLVHKGHIALINFAASQCDELIVKFLRSILLQPASLRLGFLALHTCTLCSMFIKEMKVQVCDATVDAMKCQSL